jgi:hypothetical protein
MCFFGSSLSKRGERVLIGDQENLTSCRERSAFFNMVV